MESPEYVNVERELKNSVVLGGLNTVPFGSIAHPVDIEVILDSFRDRLDLFRSEHETLLEISMDALVQKIEKSILFMFST